MKFGIVDLTATHCHWWDCPNIGEWPPRHYILPGAIDLCLRLCPEHHDALAPEEVK